MSGALQAVYMNQRSFGTPFFFGRIGDTSVNQQDQVFSETIDTSDNFICCGLQGLYQSNGTQIGNTVATVFKIDLAKTTVFRKSYGQAGNNIQFNGIVSDSSGNSYIVGNQNAGGVARVLIIKINSSGVVQWSRRLGSSTGSTNTQRNIGVDSSGNLYIAGYTIITSGVDKFAMFVAKYNSSGTIQWQRKLYQSVGNNIVSGFTVDSSGNSYLTGYSTQVIGPPNTTKGIIAKYNSSGTLQWQRQFGTGGAGSFGNAGGIAVDNGTGDMYIGCSNYNADTPSTTVFLQKLNSSGTAQWQRSYTASSMTGVAIDSSNNVYFAGEGLGEPIYRGHIVKYNSSGTIQWQRRIDATLSGQNFKYWWSISTDPNGQLGVAGLTGQGPGGINNNLGMIARYPNDGAFTGTVTVGGIAYTTEVATGTDASFSMALSTASLTDSAAGLTDESVSLTETNITTPINLVNI